MSIITMIIALVVVGFILYVINVYVPMQSTVKQILNIAVAIFLIVFLLQAFGLIPALNEIRLR